jgi:hypothetical protein
MMRLVMCGGTRCVRRYLYMQMYWWPEQRKCVRQKHVSLCIVYIAQTLLYPCPYTNHQTQG